MSTLPFSCPSPPAAFPPEDPSAFPAFLHTLYGKEGARLLADIRHPGLPTRITLMLQREGLAFLVREDGSFENGPEAGAVFEACLLHAIHTQGALLIRQFLVEEGWEIGPGGLSPIPLMRISGLGLGEGRVVPMEVDVLARMHETRNDTGELLPREPGVSYFDWRSLRDSRVLTARSLP